MDHGGPRDSAFAEGLDRAGAGLTHDRMPGLCRGDAIGYSPLRRRGSTHKSDDGCGVREVLGLADPVSDATSIKSGFWHLDVSAVVRLSDAALTHRRRNHPSGVIGRRLLPARQLLRTRGTAGSR